METTKHAGGRPPKFKTPEELQVKAEGYFQYCDTHPIEVWQRRKEGDKCLGDIYKRELGKDCRFNEPLIYDDKVCNSVTSAAMFQHFTEPLHISDSEILKACTFPIDYEAQNVKFYCGMSVPPVMAAQIANQIYIQWLSKID